jgi:thiamine-phosphate pyrophosphorylase
MTAASRYDDDLKLPAVYPILDTALLARLDLPLLDAAEALAEGGARILQIRHKENWTREAYHAATGLASYCRAAGIALIVNDRADIAVMLGAGLHVGQDDLPPRESRGILGPAVTLGFSTHNEAQLLASIDEPIDYVALGPIFLTGSKVNPDPVVGLDELKRLRKLTSRPLVAIGGIALESAIDVWRAGADSIALISDLFQTPSKSGVRARMEAWQGQLGIMNETRIP